MGRVIDVNIDQKALIRSMTLKIGKRAGNENSKRKLEQSMDNIVLLLESGDVNNDFQ